jgi:hypothetical protein
MKAQALVGGAQAIHALSDVLVVDCPGHLELDDDLVFHQQVGSVVSGDGIVVHDGDASLLHNRQALLPHLMGQGIFINLLGKSNAQQIRHSEAHPIIRSVSASDC